MTQTQTQTPFFTPATLADFLSVDPSTVDNWIAAGKLPDPIRLGDRTRRWERAAIYDWLRLSESNYVLASKALVAMDELINELGANCEDQAIQFEVVRDALEKIRDSNSSR